MAGNLFLSIDFGTPGAVDTQGTRPYPGPQPIYLNNSIFLAGGISKSQTRIGLPTTIKVRVSNRNDGPVKDVRVDAYVMNPHVGLARPSQRKRLLRSNLATITPGSGANVDTDPHVLECFLQGATGPEPWIPTADDMKDADHLCLIANCFADNDGNEWPDNQLFEIATNPHHGQRNIQVLPQAVMFTGGITTFFVMPPPEGEQQAVLQVTPVPADAITVGDLDVLASHPAVTVVDGRLVVPGEDGTLHPVQNARQPLETQLVVEDAEPGQSVLLPPMDEPRRAVLEVLTPAEGEPGTLSAVDIVQTGTAGALLGGGIRVLTLITAGPAVDRG